MAVRGGVDAEGRMMTLDWCCIRDPDFATDSIRRCLASSNAGSTRYQDLVRTRSRSLSILFWPAFYRGRLAVNVTSSGIAGSTMQTGR